MTTGEDNIWVRENPVIAILLPSALPDLSYIERCLKADLIFIDDLTPFNRKSRVHRGLIRNPDGVQWIHIPIHPDDRKKPLHEARPAPADDWLEILWRSLAYNYRNSVYFEHYEPEIRADFEFAAELPRYTNLTRHLNQRLWKYLELPEVSLPVRYFSDLGLMNANNIDIAELTEVGNIERYFKEHKSSQFQSGYGLGDKPETDASNWEQISYRQHFGKFTSGCCALDLLFGEGPMSWKVIDMLSR